MSVLTEGRFEMGIGTGRPGIEDELRELGMPVASPRERLAQVRETVALLRDLDGPDFHTPVVMAVRGLKAQALAVEVADTVTVAALSTTLVQWSPALPATSALCGMSSSALRRRSSATLSRRSWHPRGTPIRLRCGKRTRWPYSRMIRRPQPRRSRGDVRRSAIHTSSSAPTPPRYWPRWWPSLAGQPVQPREPAPCVTTAARRAGEHRATPRSRPRHSDRAPHEHHDRARGNLDRSRRPLPQCVRGGVQRLPSGWPMRT